GDPRDPRVRGVHGGLTSPHRGSLPRRTEGDLRVIAARDGSPQDGRHGRGRRHRHTWSEPCDGRAEPHPGRRDQIVTGTGTRGRALRAGLAALLLLTITGAPSVVAITGDGDG